MTDEKYIKVTFTERGANVKIHGVDDNELAYAICVLQLKFGEIVREPQ